MLFSFFVFFLFFWKEMTDYSKPTTWRETSIQHSRFLWGREEGGPKFKKTQNYATFSLTNRHLWTVQWHMQKADGMLIRIKFSAG